MAPPSNLTKLFRQQSILTHETEDDWLVVEKDGMVDSVTYTCRANGWHMVENIVPVSAVTNVCKQADLIRNIDGKANNVDPSMAADNAAHETLSRVIEQLQKTLRQPNVSKKEPIVAVLRKTVTQAPNSKAVDEVRRAAIENRLKAYQDTPKPRPHIGSTALITPGESANNAAALTGRTNYVEVVQKPAAMYRGPNSDTFPSDTLESWSPNLDGGIMFPGCSTSTRQPLLLPEPETILKAIPPEGISRSDLTLKFRPFWPLESHRFREWVHEFRAIVKSVAIYSPGEKMVKRKPRRPLMLGDMEIEQEGGLFYCWRQNEDEPWPWHD